MLIAPALKDFVRHAPIERCLVAHSKDSRRFDLRTCEMSQRHAGSRNHAVEENWYVSNDDSSSNSQRTGGPPSSLHRPTRGLFSRDEEQALFRLLKQRKNEAQSLRENNSNRVTGSRPKELIAVENSIIRIRNTILEANLGLVISVAKGFLGKGALDMSELFSEGNNVLIKAIDRFDPEYGTRFSTYATTPLRRAFISVLTSSHRQEKRFTTGAPAALDAIQDLSSPTRWKTQLQSIRDVRILLDHLNDRERFIVEERFGLLADGRAKSFRELGEQLGLSRERVRQILANALKKLRRTAKKQHISPPDSET